MTKTDSCKLQESHIFGSMNILLQVSSSLKKQMNGGKKNNLCISISTLSTSAHDSDFLMLTLVVAPPLPFHRH